MKTKQISNQAFLFFIITGILLVLPSIELRRLLGSFLSFDNETIIPFISFVIHLVVIGFFILSGSFLVDDFISLFKESEGNLKIEIKNQNERLERRFIENEKLYILKFRNIISELLEESNPEFFKALVEKVEKDNHYFELLNRPVLDINFGTNNRRIRRMFSWHEIDFIKDLVLLQKNELLRVPTFGRKCVNDLEKYLESKSLNFGMDKDWVDQNS